MVAWGAVGAGVITIVDSPEFGTRRLGSLSLEAQMDVRAGRAFGGEPIEVPDDEGQVAFG